MKTNQEIIKEFRDKLSENRDTLFSREETMLIIKAESFILQILNERTEEIRKEVERVENDITLSKVRSIEDIKTFLNKLDK